MRSETKLVKTASRGALAGGGERDRLLDDCRTPDTDWLVPHNRPGLALASPDSRPRPRRDGQHKVTSENAAAAPPQRPGRQHLLQCIGLQNAGQAASWRPRLSTWPRVLCARDSSSRRGLGTLPLHGITLHSGCCRSCAGQNVDDYDSCVDLKPLGIASQGLEPEQCSSRQHLSAAKRGDLVLLDKI